MVMLIWFLSLHLVNTAFLCVMHLIFVQLVSDSVAAGGGAMGIGLGLAIQALFRPGARRDERWDRVLVSDRRAAAFTTTPEFEEARRTGG